MRIPKRIAAMLASTLPLMVWLPATYAGDTGHGAKVFDEECAECHSARPGKNKKGPTLYGVAGRPAATVADYVYSDAMKASGVTWTPDRLDAYIAAPRRLVPGCKMKYDGLSDPAARADLADFLNTLR